MNDFYHICKHSPKSSTSIWNVSVCFLSNKFRKDFLRGRLPVSPLLPKMVMNTFAFVPAPLSSPVTTTTSYLTGTRSYRKKRNKIKQSPTPPNVMNNTASVNSFLICVHTNSGIITETSYLSYK